MNPFKLLIIGKSLWAVFFALSMLIFTHQAQAGQFETKAGAMLTLDSVPLYGVAASVGYSTEDTDDFILRLPPQANGIKRRSEVQLIQNYVTGHTTSDQDYTSGAQITFRSVELDYFFLLTFQPVLGDLYFGPGIGYGIAEITEDTKAQDPQKAQDPTPFFTGTDIHYGVFLFKLGKRWDNTSCEARFSSYGGLIGGGALCGIHF